MSAIAGILYFGGAPVAHGVIETLTDAMSARGPDEQHHWVAGSIALGHCMLRTTPESFEEHQPLTSQDKRLTLVWDGRLDNRDALRRDLTAAGAAVRNDSDAELALHSYAIWGEACPKRLLGDFAFAIWDNKQNHLFCARDPMGARPLYYTRNDRFFAFASEDEALLELPGVSHSPDEELIAYLLVPSLEDVSPSDSYFKDLHALMPANSILATPDGKLRTMAYWTLEPSRENRYANDAECQEAFREVFGKAVRCRMRSQGHVAAMMSGGMDSAAILAMARRLLPQMPGKEFHTYSAISDQPETCVESQCILSLTESLGDQAHFVSVPSFTGMVGVQDLIEAAWPKVHPLDNSILLPTLMCVAAARDGHRVLLHGVSGDITMGVPERYPAYFMREGQWARAWKECQGASRHHTYLHGKSPSGLFLRNLGTAYAPGWLKVLVRAIRKRNHKSPLARSVISKEFAARLGLADRLRAQESHGFSMPGIGQAYAKSMYAQSCGIVLGLAAYERVAGRYGVELRDPWADKRVVEFFMALPLAHKVRDGRLKYMVRSTFAPDFEDIVTKRVGKEHLGWVFTWRLMDDSTKLMANVFARDLDILDKYVNIAELRKRYKNYLETGNILEREFLYEIATLLLFIRRFT